MKSNNYILRISVTPKCNLNCIYCGKNKLKDSEIISDKELLEIIDSAVKSGVRRISWTGGEPTIRPNFVELVKKAREIGIKEQTITTNGTTIFSNAKELKKAGINRVNISLDTLNENEFKTFTKKPFLKNVLKSIDECTQIYNNTKINCVIIKKNKKLIPDFIKFAEKYGKKLTIRFLELVPCGEAFGYDPKLFEREFVSASEILEELKKFGEIKKIKRKGNVPKSFYFKIGKLKATYGINPNQSANYACDKEKCPKIRISPNGYISNCTIQLKYARKITGKTKEEKDLILQEIVEEKQNRDYTGFIHKQKYYDLWRFGKISKEARKELPPEGEKDWHLRFAITAKCNFRCKYCNSHGNSKFTDPSFLEVKDILKATYANKIKRVHYTGGEPTIRPDFLEILKCAKDIGYTEQVITTNGHKLTKILDECISNGLTRAIISLDTLNPKRNEEITQRKYFDETIKSIEACAEKLKSPTKISCVTMKTTLKELPDIVKYIQKVNSNKNNKGKVILKLNQFHPDNEAQLYEEGQKYFLNEYTTYEDIIGAVKKLGKIERIYDKYLLGDNPSYKYFKLEDGTIIGILAMMSWGFPCGKCKKLRIQPSGYVQICKNYKKSPSLIGLSFKEKKEIIHNWMHYRDFILDKKYPNRIHYKPELGEERWGDVGKPIQKEFFIDKINAKYNRL